VKGDLNRGEEKNLFNISLGPKTGGNGYLPKNCTETKGRYDKLFDKTQDLPTKGKSRGMGWGTHKQKKKGPTKEETGGKK